MRDLLSRHPFGYGTIAGGVFALWLLLAGDVLPATVADGLAVAIAASLWQRLVED